MHFYKNNTTSSFLKEFTKDNAFYQKGGYLCLYETKS